MACFTRSFVISPFSDMFSISWAFVLPLDRQAMLMYWRGFGVSTVRLDQTGNFFVCLVCQAKCVGVRDG